ncbi:MAG: hypothetical protein Ct9H300mP8_11250 [Gammaproteobacteria bacterium]|nr:MAG: hypothetical protein Ct9H300mP8_11250 [Gammaproteobacteria bacterium]
MQRTCGDDSLNQKAIYGLIDGLRAPCGANRTRTRREKSTVAFFMPATSPSESSINSVFSRVFPPTKIHRSSIWAPNPEPPCRRARLYVNVCVGLVQFVAEHPAKLKCLQLLGIPLQVEIEFTQRGRVASSS